MLLDREPMEIDDKLVHLTRNALLVAGMEMGKEGDHWPVINSNIHALMRDHENLKIENAVQEQLKEHVGKIIGDYEKFLTECDEATRSKAEPHIRKMRELHDAMFTPVAPALQNSATDHDDDDTTGYVPWKSSAAIIKGLMEE
jgi:hypothetical protein